MANTISVLFWLRRTRANKDGQVPLMIRLTFDNSKVEKATGYYVTPTLWNADKQRLKGSSDTTKQINEWMNEKMVKVCDLFNIEAKGANVHLPTIMSGLFADPKEEASLLKTILEYNEQLKLRVDKDFAFSTYEKYVFTYSKVKAFIESSLKMKDILLRDITTKFIMDFDCIFR